MWLKSLLTLTLLFFLLLPPLVLAQSKTKIQGYVQDGGQVVLTQGLSSSTKVQRSYPTTTVTVFDAGTSTPSTIYSNAAGTAKANPFTSASNGLWFFYGMPGNHYDVRFSGTGITTPFTLSDYIAPGSTSGTSAATQFINDYGASASSTDNTTAIQNTINATGSGGKLVATNVVYPIQSFLTIGNGTGDYTTGAATISTLNALVLDFQGATLKYTGASTSTPLLSVNGPITRIIIENLTIDCNGLASIGLDLNHIQESNLRNVYIVNNTAGFGIRQRAYANPTGTTNGANNNVFDNIRVNSTQANSGGITIGHTSTVASPRLNVAQTTYLNCRFRFDGASGTTIAIQLNFTDALTFINPITFATIGLQTVVPSGTSGSSYPSNVQFINPALAGGVSNTGTWVGPWGLYFHRYQTADSEPLPPLTPVGMFSGITDKNKVFGIITQNPLYFSSIISSNSINTTTSETTFSVSYTIPANILSLAGTVVRVKGSGLYSTTGTPIITFRAKLGGNTFADPVMGTGSSATNFAWSVSADCITRAVGVGTTTFPGANYAGTGGFGNGVGAGGASFTIDTTTTLAVTLTVQWSAASASNTIMMDTFIVEILYPGSN